MTQNGTSSNGSILSSPQTTTKKYKYKYKYKCKYRSRCKCICKCRYKSADANANTSIIVDAKTITNTIVNYARDWLDQFFLSPGHVCSGKGFQRWIWSLKDSQEKTISLRIGPFPAWWRTTELFVVFGSASAKQVEFPLMIQEHFSTAGDWETP